jgi:membrane protein DedA with SNARE-associated domain
VLVLAGVSDFITGDLTDWVVGVIDAIGYLGVLLLTAVENIFPPIPSEVVLPAAGFSAAKGSANVWGMVVVATIGSIVGAWALYLVAATLGWTRIHLLAARHGRWIGVKTKDLDRAEAWFADRSTIAVLVCRCVPLLRSLVSVPAGLHRMAPVPFTIYTAIGSAVWNAALIFAGYKLGANWEQVGEVIGTFQYVVIAGFAAALGWWTWTRFLSPSHRARRAAEELAEAEELEELEELEAAEELAEELEVASHETSHPNRDD